MFPAGQKQARMDLPALLVTVQAGSLLESQRLAADVNDAITAGATAVLLDGSDNAAALYEAAVKVKELLRERAALLLLDRLDIAAAVGAEGVVLSPTGERGATHVHTGWGRARQSKVRRNHTHAGTRIKAVALLRGLAHYCVLYTRVVNFNGLILWSLVCQQPTVCMHACTPLLPAGLQVCPWWWRARCSRGRCCWAGWPHRSTQQ